MVSGSARRILTRSPEAAVRLLAASMNSSSTTVNAGIAQHDASGFVTGSAAAATDGGSRATAGPSNAQEHISATAPSFIIFTEIPPSGSGIVTIKALVKRVPDKKILQRQTCNDIVT
jgi:hypothetical protein